MRVPDHRISSPRNFNSHFNSLNAFERALSHLRPLFDLQIPRGAGSAAVASVFVIAGIYGAVYGGHVEAIGTQLRDARDAAANAAGFHIASIAIAGTKEVTREEVLAAAGVTGKSSLLFLDAEAARTRLKSNPWIAEATILKLYPNRLHIALTERQAFAMWQKDKQVSVIASDGTVVQPYVDPRYANLPLVVGAGAEKARERFSCHHRPLPRDPRSGARLCVRRRAALEFAAQKRHRYPSSRNRAGARA